MKRLIIWTLAAALLMLVCPCLAVTFTGDSGMAICFILFFAINPLFSAVCGIFSGLDIKKLWSLPFITSILFLAGAWIFFDLGELAFLLYATAYLIIGTISMFITALIKHIRN